jgi:hypothetical protein
MGGCWAGPVSWAGQGEESWEKRERRKQGAGGPRGPVGPVGPGTGREVWAELVNWFFLFILF